MTSPVDYPDDHPGWGRLVAGIVRHADRHPQGHRCGTCGYRRRDPLRDAALEVVDTYRGATAPGLRAVVRHLHLALHARGR